MAHRTPDDPRCKDCANDRESGRCRCADCAKRHRQAASAVAMERRGAGLCVTCGAKAQKGKRYCAADLAYYAARRALTGRAVPKKRV